MRRELYNDTESEGLLTIEYSGLELREVVGLNKNNGKGNESAVEAKA
jgi:hypothetical protein